MNNRVWKTLESNDVDFFTNIIKEIINYVSFDNMYLVPDIDDETVNTFYHKEIKIRAGATSCGDFYKEYELDVVENKYGDAVFQFKSTFDDPIIIKIKYDFHVGGFFDGFKRGYSVTGLSILPNQTIQECRELIDNYMKVFKNPKYTKK